MTNVADGKKKNKHLNTPAPAFFVRKDSLFPDDVSTGSTTSLLDDDSGMGDSVGSRSLARKSPSPSSGSNSSGGNGDESKLKERKHSCSSYYCYRIHVTTDGCDLQTLMFLNQFF